MATVKLNPAFMNIRGSIGNIVYYDRYGTLCARSRVKPRNPRTPLQQAGRRSFAEAVRLWQQLTPLEKAACNKRGRKKNLRGYNLFISEYLKGKARLHPVYSTSAEAHDRQLPSMPRRYSSVASPLMPAYCTYTAANDLMAGCG